MEKSENEKNSGNNEEINKNENDNKNIEQDNKEEINKDNTNNDNIEIKDNTEEKQIEKQDDKTEEIINEDKGEIKIEKEINSDNNDKIEGNIEITKEETEKEIKTDIETNNENNESEKNIDSNPQQVTMEIIQAEVNPSSENFNQINYEFPKDFMDDKIRCNTLTQKLINKTKRNTELKYEEFFTKKRHYLIMTDGGKPVYSRYGDEVENNSIFATISAMITKFTIFNSTDTFKEELNVISNKKNKIVFMKKGQLIFIAFSKMVNDSVSLLHSQLEMIYNQLMSILTVKFYEKLEDNPSKVLTAMGGTENLFEQIIQYSSNSFVSIFNSYQIMNFENFGESREKINKILEENKGNSLYCILMTPYEIISFAHSNQITVQASDLILIQTLILCTEMLRTQESYVPICLPGISDQGFYLFFRDFLRNFQNS